MANLVAEPEIANGEDVAEDRFRQAGPTSSGKMYFDAVCPNRGGIPKTYAF